MTRYFAILIILLCSTAILTTAADRTEDTRKSLEKQLSEAQTSSDSILILYNLYDLAKRKDYGIYSNQIYRIAKRESNYRVMLDLMRNIATVNLSNDSIITSCLETVLKIPPSYDQKETETYLKVLKISNEVHKTKPEAIVDTVMNLLEHYNENIRTDIYTRTTNLYKLVLYLGESEYGNVYQELLTELKTQIEQLPQCNSVLSSMFNTRAADIFTYKGDCEQAIEADKNLLEIIDSLSVKYERAGRLYRDYDANKYICYRRLISNYTNLSLDEVEDYYSKILELTDRSKRVKSDFFKTKRSQAFYLMATGRYSEAVPVLKEAMENPSNKRYYRKMLRCLIEGAKKIGDNQTLTSAALEYNDILEKDNDLQTRQKYDELGMLRNVSTNRTANHQATVRELKTENMSLKSSRSMMLCTIGFLGVACVVLIVYLVISRNRR